MSSKMDDRQYGETIAAYQQLEDIAKDGAELALTSDYVQTATATAWLNLLSQVKATSYSFQLKFKDEARKAWHVANNEQAKADAERAAKATELAAEARVAPKKDDEDDDDAEKSVAGVTGPMGGSIGEQLTKW